MIVVSTHKNNFISGSKAQCACPLKIEAFNSPSIATTIQTPWLAATALYINVFHK
jgi:hypothetical protein